MLADVIDHLLCPVCRTTLALVEGAVRCGQGHSFDIARQGYVSLLTGSAVPGTADTPSMVAARADFLAAGHYAPLADRLAARCTAAGRSENRATGDMAAEGTTVEGTTAQHTVVEGAVIADAGAGTGYYLARALGERSVGIALDVSKHALKRAARAHPRIGAVVADVWRPLPVRDDSVDVLLNVFAPRNAAEFARILKPGGTLLVVTPAPGHLSPLVERLGLLSVDEDKELRLAETLGGRFARAVQEVEEFTLELGHKEVAAVVGMGPSAWHKDPGVLAESIRGLPDPVQVRVSFHIAEWTRR